MYVWLISSMLILFLPIVFKNILMPLLLPKNVRLIQALAISKGVAMAAVKGHRKTSLLVLDKKTKNYQNS